MGSSTTSFSFVGKSKFAIEEKVNDGFVAVHLSDLIGKKGLCQSKKNKNY